jgi:hypothetical protein
VVADMGGQEGALVLPAGLFGLDDGQGGDRAGNKKDRCADPSSSNGARYCAFLGLRILGGTSRWDAGTLE